MKAESTLQFRSKVAATFSIGVDVDGRQRVIFKAKGSCVDVRMPPAAVQE